MKSNKGIKKRRLWIPKEYKRQRYNSLLRNKKGIKTEWFENMMNCKDFWMTLFSKLDIIDIISLSKHWNGVIKWFNDWTIERERKLNITTSPFDSEWSFSLENTYRAQLNQKERNHVIVHSIHLQNNHNLLLLNASNPNNILLFDSTEKEFYTMKITYNEKNYSSTEIVRYVHPSIAISTSISCYQHSLLSNWFVQSSFKNKTKSISEDYSQNTNLSIQFIDQNFWKRGRWCPLSWISSKLYSFFNKSFVSWIINNDIDIACENIKEDGNHISFEYWIYADMNREIYFVCKDKQIYRFWNDSLVSFNLFGDQDNNISSLHCYQDRIYFLTQDNNLHFIDCFNDFTHSIPIKSFSKKSRIIPWNNNSFVILESETDFRYKIKNFKCWMIQKENVYYYSTVDSFCIEFIEWLDCFVSIKNFDGCISLFSLPKTKNHTSYTLEGTFDYDLKYLGFEYERSLFISCSNPILSKHRVSERSILIHPHLRTSRTRFILEF